MKDTEFSFLPGVEVGFVVGGGEVCGRGGVFGPTPPPSPVKNSNFSSAATKNNPMTQRGSIILALGSNYAMRALCCQQCVVLFGLRNRVTLVFYAVNEITP